jgi:hypothetical protein
MTMPVDDNRSPWFDDGICATNPVYVAEKFVASLESAYAEDLCRGTDHAHARMAKLVHKLCAQDRPLPAFAVQSLVETRALPPDYHYAGFDRRPGILGLVVDRQTRLSLVLPLSPQPSPWGVDRLLPFTPQEIQHGLVQLMHAAGMPAAGVIPERLAYSFDNPLGVRVTGNSMTVSAWLAILDQLGGRSAPIFSAACALVELTSDGRLKAVDYVAEKLAAALRECGRLTLVICHPQCRAVEELLPGKVSEVWRVDSLESLVKQLDRARVLDPLLSQAPLQREEAVRVRDRLQWLIRQEHNYGEAADLGDRLRKCGRSEPIEPGVWAAIGQLNAEACRHRGRFIDALGLSNQVHGDVAAQGLCTSDDEEADATAEYAAAVFENHQFDAIPELLEPWADRAIQDPRRFHALTRVKIWNTLGRALSIIGRVGAEPLFRRSLELNHARHDVDDAHRTTSYLVHSLLRADRLSEARQELNTIGTWPGMSGYSGWILRFLQADLARRERNRWIDPAMDVVRPEQNLPGHLFAFYLQATARQPETPDALDRLQRAAAFLRADAGDDRRNICALFASCIDLYAAAMGNESAAWNQSSAAVRAFLEDSAVSPIKDYYAPALSRLSDAPDLAVAERFLSLIPYF